MKTKLITSILMVGLLTSCASGQVNTAAGAAIGAIAGAAVGAHNKAPVTGAITGAVVGGLIGNVVDQNQAANTPTPLPPPPSPSIPSNDIVVREAPVVVVETPVIIDERIWVGNDLWIYSYHGFRDAHGHIRYQNRIPFHRSFVRGGIPYRRH